jgi:hypothetical protein
MLLEALGTSPAYPGPLALSALAAPPTLTAAPKPGVLLSSVIWQLTPVLSVLWDNATAANSAIGWDIADSKLTLAPFLTPPALNGSLSIISTASPVTVTFALSLSSTYSSTLLTQRVPITQLLANIVGLSGLLAFFGMSFGWFEAACAKRRREDIASRLSPGTSAQPAEAITAADGALEREASAFRIKNPLHHTLGAHRGAGAGSLAAEDSFGGVAQQPLQPRGAIRSEGASAVHPAPPLSAAPAPGSALAPSRWIRVTNGEETWYLAEADRKATWVLPPGGIIVREEREP